jgi:hypothetical protein
MQSAAKHLARNSNQIVGFANLRFNEASEMLRQADAR